MAKGGVASLFTVQAGPNDPNYADVVQLFLIVNEQYDAQRAYKLDVLP